MHNVLCQDCPALDSQGSARLVAHQLLSPARMAPAVPQSLTAALSRLRCSCSRRPNGASLPWPLAWATWFRLGVAPPAPFRDTGPSLCLLRSVYLCGKQLDGLSPAISGVLPEKSRPLKAKQQVCKPPAPSQHPAVSLSRPSCSSHALEQCFPNF